MSLVPAMAWREGRAGRRQLSLLTAAVAVGVAALVAINSFTVNLRRSVEREARTLMGADLAVIGRRDLPDTVMTMLDSVVGAPGGGLTRVTSFSGMAYVPRTQGARLVQVAAVGPGYPFYGEIQTAPAGAWQRLSDTAGAPVLVDPSLLTALNARMGDTLALGRSRFVIAGAVTRIPGDVGVRAAFGPRIFIPYSLLDATGLLGFGARAEYDAYLRLPPGLDAERVAERLKPILAPERLRVRTVADDERNLTESLTTLSRYLGLVALIALLLGGLGVASAVHVFVRRKREVVAVLRCLGASARQVFSIYLAQALVMSGIGSVLGAALGLLIQLLLPGLLADFLPVDVAFRVAWSAVAAGIGMGIWVAAVFALSPLLAVRRISPLSVLRRPWEDAGGTGRDGWRWVAWLLLAASIAGLSVLQAGALGAGLAFAAGIGVALGVLALAGFLLTRALRRWFPSGWPYLWRQGLANLYRPANQTLMVVLALGFGAFLLGTLILVQENLLRDLRFGGAGSRPNLVLFDIQPDQRLGIDSMLHAAGYRPQPAVPIVPMRITQLNGRDVASILADTARRREGGERVSRWAVRREYRSTYRDTTVASEKVVLGSWWSDSAGTRSPIPISVESGVAGDLGVTVGDTIVWDVQGLRLTTRVANLRDVDWVRFEPNFFVVFPDGPLDGAPQMLVTMVRVPGSAERGAVQREVVERYPNISGIDLTQLQDALERLIDRVVLVIRFMALFSLVTGAVVLIGAVATSRFQRVRESVILKTLGATRRQVLGIAAAEYLSLGLLAVVIALTLALAAGYLLVRHLFHETFDLPARPLLALGGAIVLLTVVVGLWNSREVVRKTPLEVLREE